MLRWELFALLSVGTIASLLLWKSWQIRRRNSVIRGMLDDVDQVEKRLLDCRERLREIDNLLGRLPPDITPDARAALNNESNIRPALKIILQYRLWIREHAQKSSLKNLSNVSESIRTSLHQLNSQIMRLIEVANVLQAAYVRSAALIDKD